MNGLSHDKVRLHRIWVAMRNRCQKPSNTRYADYGGRGICVCEEWNNYDAFKNWAMDNGYADDLSIDRIDNNGNYCPENCRWATALQQANNKSINRFLTYEGKTQSCRDWDREMGYELGTISTRLHNGWSAERAIAEPVNAHSELKRYTSNGETHTVTEWADLIGMDSATLWKRLELYNMSIEEALSKPLRPRKLYVTYNGETHTLSEWSKITGIKTETLRSRINKSKWDIEKALTTPMM